jgi:hypothetical protein
MTLELEREIVMAGNTPPEENGANGMSDIDGKAREGSGNAEASIKN